jgi:hypothetical protein
MTASNGCCDVTVKRLRFIPVFVVLLPVAAIAQTDSMTVHFHLWGSSIPYWFTTMITEEGKMRTGYHSGEMPVQAEFSVKQVLQDSFFYLWNPPNSGIAFIIDTQQRVIKGLRTTSQVNYTDHPRGFVGCQIWYQEIPMTTNTNSFITQGKCTGEYNISAAYYNNYLGGAEQGQWDSSGVVTDSVLIEVSYVPKSMALAKRTDMVRKYLYFDNYSSSLFFEHSNFYRIIEITNPAGGNAKRIDITPNIESISVGLLPPGCYFARLGTEVAKFVVMP